MNETIKNQLNHRSIRKFKNIKLKKEEIELLVDVARHTASSNFRQAYSIISITDQKLKNEIAVIGNQEYIAREGHLFVFVVDQRRIYKIAKEKGIEPITHGYTERFMSGLTDAVIAAQNMVVAAESLGMGTVYLGSILNDTKKMIELLELPKYVFPAVGLLVGWPDQEPQLKPRLPRNIVHMENKYVDYENILEELEEYDDEVSAYYDMRDLNNRVDKYTVQLSKQVESTMAKRIETLKVLREQGFMLEE